MSDTTAIKCISLPTSEIAVGDFVLSDGMICHVNETRVYPDVNSFGGKVTVHITTVINRDEVIAQKIVPAGFLRRDDFPGRDDVWTIQGNDLATWRCAEMRVPFDGQAFSNDPTPAGIKAEMRRAAQKICTALYAVATCNDSTFANGYSKTSKIYCPIQDALHYAIKYAWPVLDDAAVRRVIEIYSDSPDNLAHSVRYVRDEIESARLAEIDSHRDDS